MHHGGGSVYVQGTYRNEPDGNPFFLKTRLNNVNVSKLFYAFDDFGQKSLTDKNIRGNLSADITLEGSVSPEARLMTEQFKSR